MKLSPSVACKQLSIGTSKYDADFAVVVHCIVFTNDKLACVPNSQTPLRFIFQLELLL